MLHCSDLIGRSDGRQCGRGMRSVSISTLLLNMGPMRMKTRLRSWGALVPTVQNCQQILPYFPLWSIHRDIES